MRTSVRTAAAFALAVAFTLALRGPAHAIPLFAQRYQLQCSACHSVLPELNAFGNAFRAHGYQLPIPKHGTTGVAMRYQLEWEADPAAGTRRFSPGGVLLSNADIGAVSAFIHYNLGAGGGPAGLFLGYLATYNAHTQSLYRLGLFELPLAQSPGQRLDDLASYGYYGAHVGLNDLSLSSPRWGLQAERAIGSVTADFTVDFGEFKGSAYGGKPVPTGETTAANSPEFGMFLRAPLTSNLQVGGDFITGSRRIVPAGRNTFSDAYQREGVLAKITVRNVELQAEQWWGSDQNADGFGTRTGSTGGYARLKYYITPHAYLGVRYDAQAVPFISRDVVYYAAFHILPHARLLLQQVQPVGASGHLGAALTVGFPWPPNL